MNTDKINKIKLRLKEIEKEKEQLLIELKSLSISKQNNIEAGFTPQDKINIFRSLFKGREDVFAKAGKTNKVRPDILLLKLLPENIYL